MARKPHGSVRQFGEIWRARVVYVDPEAGEKRELVRKRRTRNEALDELGELEREAGRLERGRPRSGATFEEFARYYVKHYAVEPVFVVQEKGIRLQIAGKKKWKEERRIIERDLVPAFGRTALDEISYAKINTWRIKRFQTPIHGKSEATKHVVKPRSLGSVHRPLEILRRMLTVAIEESWMDGPNPFKSNRRGASALIQKSKETKRRRILTVAEEERLLAAFESEPRRQHWTPRVIAAIDTGMRRGEIDLCQWWQVDFYRNAILVVAEKLEHETPKMINERGEDRIVALTERLRQQIQQLWQLAKVKGTDGADDRVFPQLGGTTSTAWRTACRIAGIENLRVHDLRHVVPTRLSAAGVGIDHIGKLLGQSQPSTTWRYMNVDLSMQQDAARRLEQYRGEELKKEETAQQVQPRAN